MMRIAIFTGLFLIAFGASAQHVSQYNTETLYDSFENPSQRSFIPDSSRYLASNFLIPNFNINTYLTGNIQPGIKTRLFATTPYYNTQALKIGQSNYSHFNANVNNYWLMLKMFSSLSGDVEMGIAAQTKVEARGYFSDESLGLLAGPITFPASNYINIFNDRYRFQSYHQISFSYRERIDDQVALGFKISALLGVQYQQVDIVQSHINFDKINDKANIGLRGRYYDSFAKDNNNGFGPSLNNPGAAISLGGSYQTDDKINFQVNIKDLGFIHWNRRSNIYDFNGSRVMNKISSASREDTIYNSVQVLLKQNGIRKSFITAIDSRAELSISKGYWLNEAVPIKFIPTFLVSKEIFDRGFTGAWINRLQVNAFNFSLAASYDDMKSFNLGTQIMIKSPNMEFFVGSDRLLNTVKFAAAALNTAEINRVNNYTGGNFFIGFSLKFGRVINHPMNADFIPMGNEGRGFLGRLFGPSF
jgi:hypothetical protein